MITKESIVKESSNTAVSREKKAKTKDVVETIVLSKYFAGVGRRKTAVARVRISEISEDATQSCVVNKKLATAYFPTLRLQQLFLSPLRTLGLENKVYVSVHVCGGGPSGQASAAGLGLARALVVMNPEYRALLKAGKLLSRDSRKVERKKPGLKKARRAPQWSKR